MPDNTARKQLPKEMREYCFKPGQSGNPKGRPKSARSKLSESFIKALAKDFKKNGVTAIEALRRDNPKGYVDAVGKLVPREDTVEHTGGISVSGIERTFVDPKAPDG
jgi:hypothetical protein